MRMITRRCWNDPQRWYDVYVSARDVRAFRASWPASSIPDGASFRFTFDARNGDLVEVYGPDVPDDAGPAMGALATDAQEYGSRQILRRARRVED